MSVSRRASFAAGIAAVRRQKKRANMGPRDIVEEAEGQDDQDDTNHITVIPGGYPPPCPGETEAGKERNGDGRKNGFHRPKPKMQAEIRAFTKESLEKINLRTANLIRDYGFLPKRSAHIEDGAQLPMKFEPFPEDLLGKPIEELDQFVYEKTFCTVSRRFQKPFLQRFSASSSLFVLPPWNCLRKAAVYISVNQYFDYLVMLTILANCAFLAMTEPINEAEYVFLGIYTSEMIIKVLAKGFILNNYTYLRNPWNWLDFLVISSGYLTSFIDMGNLAGLRTFRVLRALKTVSIMPGLKTIINALLHSVKQLAEVMTLTVFCLMVFALFALQVYMGQLRNKCIMELPEEAPTNWTTWVTDSSHWFHVNGEPELCGNASGARSCPHGFVCLGSIGGNPNYGFTSFDNLLWAMLTTFQLITLDYWENVYNMVVATGGPIHVIFFTIVVFFGSFYLINLMLAVVAMSYEEEAELMNAEKAKELEEAAKSKEQHKEVADECTIRTNSPKFPQEGGDPGCGQCSKKENHNHVGGGAEKKEKRKLVVRAGQAGAELRSVGVAGDGSHHHQAKFNITVPIPGNERALLSSSSVSLHDCPSMSEYSSHTHSGETSVNDSGVVGDHDQDSLYDLTVNNIEGNIINCKEKLERKPSKIDIPFVVSIESSSDRNCGGCETCCINYPLWLKFQDFLYKVINDTFFDVIVTLCIILNTVFLAIEHHGMSEDLQYVLDIGNKVFTTFFLFEAILKLAALSKEYFANGWNIFDLVIVVASLLDLGLESVDGISVMRGMRLMRVLKLAQSWTTMKVLLSIIISTLGALGNLTFILLIVIYIFAVLGMQLFGKDYTAENFYPDPIPRWNFTDFFHSFMMIFRILCGEWIEPLWDCMRVQTKSGNPSSCLAIFIPALVVGNFMVLNLFLALLLNNFNSDELKQRKEEVETSEKNAFTKRIDGAKNKITKARSDLRVRVGLPALQSEEKFPSNGSLLAQNGIKYCSEPELKGGDCAHAHAPDRCGSRACSEGPECAGYVNIEARGDTLERGGGRPKLGSDRVLNRRSLSERDINDICQTSKSLSFGSGSAREDKSETPVNAGPDPCLPELCDKVCCSFMEESWIYRKCFFFRSVVHDIVDNPFFEWTVLLLIFASSLSLCFEDVNLQDNEELKFILKIVNLVFAVLFTIEMFLKWIAFGLNKYFASVWTCLDFVIVLVSVLSLAVEGNSNLTAFRSLRTLRALRPLRAISRWQGMKIVVNALMYAIPSIFNVLLVCLVFWLIFSIMGVQFFGGKFYKCLDEDNQRLPATVVADKWECANKNYSWVNSKITFDHVGHAYLALFQVATFEGWMEIMADAVDATEVDQQPVYEASLYNYFYFVIFIVCGSFFTLNLFIGVIIDNFNALKKKYEGGVLEMFLTESQKHYYTAMKKLGRKKPQKVIKRPQNPYHALFYDISVSRRFEIAIFVLIFLNMVSMGIEHFDQSRAVTFVLEICNALFTTIFSLECTVKIIGLRHHYFTTAWNLFDFVLVIASIVGIVMEDLMEDFPVSPTLLRVVRVFRIGRILRLIRAAKGIRKLLFALIVSLPALFNIGALLALITFIYAIIGMTIFGHVKHQGAVDDLVNFETFGRSMQLLFRLVTSAGWNDVLDPLMAQPPDCDPDYKQLPNGNCGFPFVSIIYFVSFIIINFMIVINMYIAIILENFNQAHQEEEIGIVEEDLEMFYGKWSKFDPHATQFITFNQMSDFIASLDPPLGIPKPNTLAIVSFDLPIAKGDKIHCLDVLHSLTKYTLGFVDDDSEEFAKLSEQMDEKFKKQFPTRKELEIVSSTREWKRLDTAARCIQKFFRLYLKVRTSGGLDERIDTETQTRRAVEKQHQGEVSPRSNPDTADSRSLHTSDNLDTDNDLDQCYPGPGDSLDELDRGGYRGQERDRGQYTGAQPVQDQHQRQADVRAELHNYRRGPGPEARQGGELQPPAQRGRGLIYQYEEGQDPEHPHFHQYEDEVCLKCDNAGLLSQTADNRQPSLSPRTSPRRCATEDPGPPVSPGRLSRSPHSEGCDYVPSPAPGPVARPPGPGPRPVYPPPPHLTHVSYPGYPSVSVQDYTGHTEPRVSDQPAPYPHPYYPPPRHYMPPRLPHPHPRRQLPPPPRFGPYGPPYRYFRPPFPPMMPGRHPPPPHAAEYGGGEVHLRHHEYQHPGYRRPVSELSPRQFYVQNPVRQPEPPGPGSLPRRRLPDIPQERRLPDTLPRTARPSYQGALDQEFQDYPDQPQPPLDSRSQPSSGESKAHPRQSNIRPEHKSPKKSPVKHDDIKVKSVRETKDKAAKTREGRQGKQQHQSRSPHRQGKSLGAADPGYHESPRHNRTKSDVGGSRGPASRSKSHRHRVRRQSPVEERLSVHESDSMSDAFDDEGLFQIDENFAKFLDDKTSCQK